MTPQGKFFMTLFLGQPAALVAVIVGFFATGSFIGALVCAAAAVALMAGIVKVSC